MSDDAIFQDACTPADTMFLEALAREHHRDVKVVYVEKNGKKSLHLETKNPHIRDFFVFMLKQFQERKREYERLYGMCPEWEFGNL